jgi:hypothetical protein
MLNAYTKHTPKTIPAHTPTYTMHTAKLYLMYAVETKSHQGLTPHYIQHIHRFFVKRINKGGDVCKGWRTVVRVHIRDSLAKWCIRRMRCMQTTQRGFFDSG